MNDKINSIIKIFLLIALAIIVFFTLITWLSKLIFSNNSADLAEQNKVSVDRVNNNFSIVNNNYEKDEEFSLDSNVSRENIKNLWEKIYEVLPGQNRDNINFSLKLLASKQKHFFQGKTDSIIIKSKVSSIIMRSGESYSFDFKCDKSVYLYLIQIDSVNKIQLLWPKNKYCELSIGKNPIKNTLIPPVNSKDNSGNIINGYKLDETIGEELFLGIISQKSLGKYLVPLLKNFNSSLVAKGAGRFSINIGKVDNVNDKSELLLFEPFLSNDISIVFLNCKHSPK